MILGVRRWRPRWPISVAEFATRHPDADETVRNIQAHYDNLPDNIQAELPLKRVWTLFQSEG